jgi:hypothetical protein
MKGFRRNIADNQLGLAFCLFLVAFMAVLYTELPKLRFMAAAVPFLFITLTCIFAILKLLLFLTQSPALKRLDEVRFIKVELPAAKEKPPGEAENPLRVLGFILSTFLLLGMVYVFGFLLSALLFGFVFTYLPTRKIATAAIVAVLLTVVSHIFSSILPGKLWQGILFMG